MSGGQLDPMSLAQPRPFQFHGHRKVILKISCMYNSVELARCGRHFSLILVYRVGFLSFRSPISALI